MVDWTFLYNPKLREIVKRALEYVKKLKAEGKSWEDFELADIGAQWWDVRKLVYDYGIFKITYKSSRHTFYAFAVPIEEVEKMLRKFEVSPDKWGEPKEGEIKVPDSPEELFGVIEGYDDYKWIIWKGLKKWAKGGKPPHFLLVGPPSTAKTLFLECIENKVGRTIYVAGESARRGGFVERILEGFNRWGKAWILEVDEIGRLDSDALKTLHNLMEYRLDIPVSGKQISVKNVRIMVIATSNTLYNVPETIRSRFGQPLVFSAYSEEQYIRAAVKALTELEGIPKELAQEIAVKTAKMGIRDVRVARQIALIVDSKDEIDKAIKILFKKKDVLV